MDCYIYQRPSHTNVRTLNSNKINSNWHGWQCFVLIHTVVTSAWKNVSHIYIFSNLISWNRGSFRSQSVQVPGIKMLIRRPELLTPNSPVISGWEVEPDRYSEWIQLADGNWRIATRNSKCRITRKNFENYRRKWTPLLKLLFKFTCGVLIIFPSILRKDLSRNFIVDHTRTKWEEIIS